MPSELGEALSERELDVIKQLALGAVNREIAETLSISPNTVKVHLRNIYTKLGVTTRTEAVAVSMQNGLIPSPGQPESTSEAAASLAKSATDAIVAPADVAADPEPETASGAEAAPKATNWRLIAFASGFVALAILLIFWWSTRSGPEAAEVGCAELPIGDSNWRTSSQLPTPLTNMATATNGLNIYHIGGESEGDLVADVAVFDTSNCTWRTATSKPTAIADTTATVIFGEIYVPGGRVEGDKPSSIVEVYSPVNNGWRTVANIPKAVTGALALTDGNLLYLFGGWDGEEYLTDAYAYDPGNDAWRPLPDLPQPTAFAAGGFIRGRFYVVGGFDGDKDLTACHWYDAAAAVWQSCPEMLEARAGAAGAVIFDRLYIVGGGWHDEVTFSEYLDTSNETWQVVNDPQLASNDRWAHLGVSSVERRIYAMGGQLNQGPSRDNLVFVPFPYESFIPASSSSE